MARGLPTGGQGSKVYVLCAESKEHKYFRPGTRLGGFEYPAGRIGDRADREVVYVPDVYVHRKETGISFNNGAEVGEIQLESC